MTFVLRPGRTRRSLSPAIRKIRAQALLGLSRVLRKSGNRAAALDTLSRLEALGSVSVADQPAALVAKHARARLFEDAKRRRTAS